MKTSPELMAMALRGRWMPSKMVVSRPGPSSTDRGLPVRSTPSPTVRPAVSSYTCRNRPAWESCMTSSYYMFLRNWVEE